jgi:hypothetical protein
MKQILVLAAMLFSGLLLVPQAQAAQFGRGDDRVCLYQDIHYEGWAECYRPGDQVATMRNHNDNVSSIRIYGRATIIVYDSTNFRGQAAEFASDVPDLGLRSLVGSRSWSDKIESFEVGSLNNRRPAGFGSPGFGSPRAEEPESGICVYEDANYRGRSQCWIVGTQQNDLARAGNWSDRISSIRVFGRTTVQLFRDHGFYGEELTIDQDVPDLARVGSNYGNWNDSVSSLKVESERGNGRQPPRPPFGRTRRF